LKLFFRGVMKRVLFILCVLSLVFSIVRPVEARNADSADRHQNRECCNKPDGEKCNLEKRGWCGKRKGDWYGARRPVNSVADAREQLARYYASQQKTVAELAEKPWRFEADLLDNCGKVVDRVMIDKRSGRIRSIY